MDGLGRRTIWVCVAVACGVVLPLRAQTADERFEVAAEHYSRGWYDRATESFGQFASIFPNDPRAADARFFQGEAALAAGSLDAARDAFATLIETTPTGERAPHAEFRLAEIAFRQERFDDAAKAYADFVASRPDHPLAPNAAMQAGHAQWRRGAFDDAEAAYREGLAQAANEDVAQEFRLALARTYAALDRRADAIRFYETVLGGRTAAMAEAELRRELAECRFASDDFRAAATEFAAAFSAQTDSAVKQALAARLVEAHSRAENWQALCDFAQSEPGAAALAGVPEALSRVAGALDRLSRGDEAIVVREGLLAGEFAEDVRAKALRQLALAAFEQGDTDDATKLCEAHATLVPAADADAAVRSRWARALIAAGKPGDAEKLLAECLELDGLADEARAYLTYDLGIAVAKQDQPQRALEILQSAPDDVPAEIARAIALAAADAATYAGDWKTAEEELRRYLSFEEGAGDEPIRRRLFVAVANRGNDDGEAARLLRTLAKDGEADAFYWTALDRFLQRVEKGSPELFAEFATLRESEQAPDALVARSKLQEGFDALAKGEAERADAAFRAVETASPEGAPARDAAWGLLELAATQTDLAKVDEQIERLKTLKADDARLRQASLLRSRCLKDSGDAEGSVAELQKLIAALDSETEKSDEQEALLPIALFDLADRQAELGRDDESAAALERLIEKFAQSPLADDAAYRLAERAYRLERTAECEALLADLLAGEPRAEIAEHALYLRGQNAAREEAWDRVAESMTKLVETSPKTTLRFEAEYWIAEALFRQKDFAGAGARFDALAAQMKGDEPVWTGMIPLRRAQLLAAGSNFAEALALIAKFDQTFPEFRQRHEVEYLRGRCLARLGRFEEARTAFDAAIRSPWGGAGEIAAMAQWMIGETYFHQERFEEAIAAYELVEAKHAFPKWQATALLQAGKCYERLDRPEEAARNYAYLLKNYGQTPLAEEATKRLRATSNRPRQALRQAETKREVE